jgi:hypothetical protein
MGPILDMLSWTINATVDGSNTGCNTGEISSIALFYSGA